jgi:UDPglucose 6-dehydrogenase
VANEAQKLRIVEKIVARLGENLAGCRFALWGLAFKPNTDDMRFAPSIDIIAQLKREGAAVRAFDPQGQERAKQLIPDVTYCKDPYEVAQGSDCLAIVTEWDEFRQLDLKRIKGLLKLPIIIDGRNVFDPKQMEELGFIYRGIGR